MQLSTATSSATAKVAKPAPMQPLPRTDEPVVPVTVSDAPAERLDQLVGFFQRNPGWMRTGEAMVDARAALDHVPGVGRVFRDLTEPADVGYGQAIRDQTEWQMQTGRQPNNAWWLRMNRQLVEDPLTAERAVRSGRVAELTTEGERAWAEYIRRSDKLYAAMGLTPEQVAARADEGRPVALSDAWKGVSLAKRAYAELVLKPWVRKALWVAHRKTLEDGRPQAMREAIETNGKTPEEMSFASSWATLIGYWSYLSPHVIGNQSKLAQGLILPLQEHVDGARLPWVTRAFVKLADWLDPVYEREIVPAAAEATTA